MYISLIAIIFTLKSLSQMMYIIRSLLFIFTSLKISNSKNSYYCFLFVLLEIIGPSYLKIQDSMVKRILRNTTLITK